MDYFSTLSSTFAKARSDASSSAVGGYISSLLIEEFDEEGVWQQLELTNKKFSNKVDIQKPSLAAGGADDVEDGGEEEEDDDEQDMSENEDAAKDASKDNDDFEPPSLLYESDDDNSGSRRPALLSGLEDDDEDEDEEEEDDEDEEGDEESGIQGENDWEEMDDFRDVDDDVGEGGEQEDDDEGSEQESAEDISDGDEDPHDKALRKQIAELERQNLAPKSWEMSGEVAGPTRPQNSLLQEHLDVDHVTRGAPEVTEEKSQSIEDRIIQRIKDQAWDDVVRREKPVEKPYEYRKATPLDQEKSKLSIAQVYEKEYLDQAQKDAPKEEPKEIRDIRYKMKMFFAQLDALCNYHYTPKATADDVKIVTNRPAIEVEEILPASTADSTLLAPEEVKAAQRKEAKGVTEKTDTDRKRERRSKKTAQRLRAAKQQKKLKTSGNKRAAAIDQVEKAAKAGKVKIVGANKETTDKAIKSSSAFFARLQDEATAAVSKAKVTKEKKRAAMATPAQHYKL